MNGEIRKRIDAVRRGEVPEGYNIDRAMLYPDDWVPPVPLNKVLKENKARNDDLAFGKEDVLSVSGEQGIVNQMQLLGRSYAGESVAPYHVVETGDVVYTKSPLKENPYGIIKQNRGKPGIVSTLYAVYHCDNPITGQYLENYFSIDAFLNNYLKPLVKRGAKNDMKVNNEDVLLGRIPLPPIDEQRKINEVIAHFDQLIELKQKRVEELKQLKKTCLAKMFPRDGADVPELRFPGFTAPWAQRKLSDLAEIVGGGTPDTNNPAYWDGEIDWYAPAEMEGQRYAVGSVRKITELGLQKSSAKMLPAYRTVLFTSRAGIGKMAILQKSAATNQGFQSLVLREGADPYFIYSMGDKIKDMAEGVASGSTFLEISGKMLGNLEVMIPSIDEQKEIASFFREIDDLITLHQRELEAEQQKKKALMQLLLTGLVRIPD